MKLKDIITDLIDNRGKNAPSYSKEGYAIIDSRMIKNASGYIDLSKTEKYLPKTIHDKFIRNDLKKDDLIITLVGNIGDVALTPTGNCVIIQNQIGLRLKKDIIPLYIYYELIYKNNILKNMNTSATQPSIKKDNLLNLELKIVSKEKQKIVVKNISTIKNIINLKKAQLQDLEKLIKAKYFEMFGDPINNQKGFPVFKVDDIITFKGGTQPEKKYFEYARTSDNIRLIQLRDYKNSNHLTYIPKKLAKRTCTATDIMIGRYGPPIFQILDGLSGAYNVALIKATPKKGNQEFIRAFLKQDCLFKYIDALSQRTGGQTGIDMAKLKAYPFPYPPLELQNAFADFIFKINIIRTHLESSIQDLESLLNQKMYEYFA